MCRMRFILAEFDIDWIDVPMKKLPLMLAAIAAAALPTGIAQAQSGDPLAAYDVVWGTPSADAAGSMPIGNGEVVLNVWVEKATGDVLFYIGRTDSLSEISRVLKIGGVRVHMVPSPFVNAAVFRQHLILRDGRIEFCGDGAHLGLFVDSGAHVVHLSGSFQKPTRVQVQSMQWRNQPHTLLPGENGSAWSVHDAPFTRTEAADVYLPDAGNSITWYHRNETSIVPALWENQSLTGLPGTFDPIIHRTFGATIQGVGLVRNSPTVLESNGPVRQFAFRVATHAAQTATVAEWKRGLRAESAKSSLEAAMVRTRNWWHAYWQRSYVFIHGDESGANISANKHSLRKGFDSNNQNKFVGKLEKWKCVDRVLTEAEMAAYFRGASPGLPQAVASSTFKHGITLLASIQPDTMGPARIFDKVTAGASDGFLFDIQPGNSLRLIIGPDILTAPGCLIAGKQQDVAATYNPATGEATIYADGKRVAVRLPESGSTITRGYVLQRYVQACQSRGQYPVKFNGGYYTVEPHAMGMPYNADYRNWGDSIWLQNVRHMYHPMLASGDFEMTEAFFRLYEAARPLAESRTRKYHGSEGAYFPETMTLWGTYSGGDYGWDRTGHVPADVLCPYWAFAWNQGPEIVALMLDRWDYTRDTQFLQRRVLPMAESVLRYFDTRFKKDTRGKVILDPTQAVETYWYGVVNDMPTTAGLIAITSRLKALPAGLVDARRKSFFEHMRQACPDIPVQMHESARELAPAQKYNPQTSNCENSQLYAVWPFQVVTLAKPALLPEARRAYEHRLNHLDAGWGYDGNVAALLGMRDEAARVLKVKARNSHPAYRWPATWGPNYDWLPDQNHGGNLLNTTQLMLMQAEPIESGGAILLLPAWPKQWDVSFKLHAPGNTTVECTYRKGKVVTLRVTPEDRAKDVRVLLPK